MNICRVYSYFSYARSICILPPAKPTLNYTATFNTGGVQLKYLAVYCTTCLARYWIHRYKAHLEIVALKRVQKNL